MCILFALKCAIPLFGSNFAVPTAHAVAHVPVLLLIRTGFQVQTLTCSNREYSATHCRCEEGREISSIFLCHRQGDTTIAVSDAETASTEGSSFC